MEATGRDGGSGPWSWINRYRREQTGGGSSSFIISRSSGTTASTTTYTSSTASRLSSVSVEAAALHFGLEMNCGDEDVFSWKETGVDPLGTGAFLTYKGFDLPQFSPTPLDPLKKKPPLLKETTKERKMEQMVLEFFGAPSSANCIGDMSVLERWFKELGVAWVLQLASADAAAAAAASAGRMLKRTFDSQSWIRALTEIKESIRLTTSLAPVWEEEEPETESAKQHNRSDQFQIAHFFEQTMLKMLGFVDLAVSDVLATNVVPELYEKLNTLLYVHTALSNALLEFQVRLHSSPCVEAERIESEMVSLLSAKEDKAREAIWNTLVGIWDCLLESMQDSPSKTPQTSPEIHILTESVMGHITFLLDNFSTVAAIVSQTAGLVKYVTYTGGKLPLDSVIMGMMERLEEMLANMSNPCPDQGLGLLFLLNNTWYIRESLEHTKQSNLDQKIFDLAGKIKGYKERYLEVSWEPPLSCLFNPSHLSLLKRYSPLSRFESEFQKTYTTQKLWEVPDPKLRRSLRGAVTKAIVPRYTKFIKDNKVTTPKFTQEDLERMPQELFEG